MPSLGSLIDPAAAVGPNATGAEVYARFQADPALLVIAVVDAARRPIGLLERNAFFLRMAAEYARALFADRPVASLMEAAPLVADAEVDAETFWRETMVYAPAALLRGFVVVRGGRYLGVGTALSLLPAARQPNDDAERLARAEAAAEAALQERTRFLDVLNTEVGAAMSGVLAVAELLDAQPMTGDGAAYVRTISDCGRTVLRLMSDAVELSRVDSGALAFAPRPVRLRDVLDDVQTRWSPRAVEDGVALGAVFQGEAGAAAELDADRLTQVYHLLIGHALQLTRRGGVEAGLSAEPDGDRVRLRGHVRDTGPRLAPERLPFLFEPFGPEGRAAYGSGLDLALARRLIEAMGGRIWAETNEGVGSTILFELHAAACEAPAQAASEPVADSGPALSGHILVVDDNATNRTVARTLVEMFGCTCEAVIDGVEAVEAVSQGRFDAVLMDIRMPRMDGLAAARAIRALPGPASAVPIVALTANADPEDARVYRAAGMVGLVEKPMKAERLLLALSEALLGAPLDKAQAAA